MPFFWTTLSTLIIFLLAYSLGRYTKKEDSQNTTSRTITLHVDTSMAEVAFANLQKAMNNLLATATQLKLGDNKFLFHQHKTSSTMRNELSDEVAAAEDINYTISSGTVTGSKQKVLIDKTDKTETPDGDPVDLNFSTEEQNTIVAAADAAVKSVLDARTAAQS